MGGTGCGLTSRVSDVGVRHARNTICLLVTGWAAGGPDAQIGLGPVAPAHPYRVPLISSPEFR